MMNPSENPPQNAANGLSGSPAQQKVEGLLWVLCISLVVVRPILYVIFTGIFLSIISLGPERCLAIIEDNRLCALGLKDWLLLLSDFILLGADIWIGLRLWRMTKGALTWAKRYYAFLIVWGAALYLAVYFDFIPSYMSVGGVFSLFVPIAWLWYLSASSYVKSLFPEC
jgi:hypothetical protein